MSPKYGAIPYEVLQDNFVLPREICLATSLSTKHDRKQVRF